MLPQLLLDSAARRKLQALLAGQSRPSTIDVGTWRRLLAGAEAAIDYQVFNAVTALVGPELAQLLRQASEAAAHEIQPQPAERMAP